jgi:hypothetical protein
MNVSDHYWIIDGSSAEVYQSKTNTMIAAADQAYVDWSVANVASPIVSEAELAGALQANGSRLPYWMFNAESFIQPTPTTYTEGQLAAYSGDARYRRENSGVIVTSLGGSVPFSSDLASRNAIDTAWGYMNAKGTANSISWKMSDGSFITLSTAQITTLMTHVSTFIQYCFECEHATADAIAGGTITALEQIDAAYAAINNTFP